MALIVVLVNKSDLADISDYEYQVLVGDGTPARSKTIAAGRIEGHRRDDGWQPLVARVVQQQQEGGA